MGLHRLAPAQYGKAGVTAAWPRSAGAGTGPPRQRILFAVEELPWLSAEALLLVYVGGCTLELQQELLSARLRRCLLLGVA